MKNKNEIVKNGEWVMEIDGILKTSWRVKM